MKVVRKFYRCHLKDVETGEQWVSSDYYEYGGYAGSRERGQWIGFVKSQYVLVEKEIEPEDFESERDVEEVAQHDDKATK